MTIGIKILGLTFAVTSFAILDLVNFAVSAIIDLTGIARVGFFQVVLFAVVPTFGA